MQIELTISQIKIVMAALSTRIDALKDVERELLRHRATDATQATIAEVNATVDVYRAVGDTAQAALGIKS